MVNIKWVPSAPGLLKGCKLDDLGTVLPGLTNPGYLSLGKGSWPTGKGQGTALLWNRACSAVGDTGCIILRPRLCLFSIWVSLWLDVLQKGPWPRLAKLNLLIVPWDNQSLWALKSPSNSSLPSPDWSSTWPWTYP